LATIAEITEEISNLADAMLEYALKLAAREMDNRYGTPLETDAKGRSLMASFCVVALGKLGSRELNYSSDIDLLFLYSNEGNTSGRGSRGTVTNREYFVKLAEFIIKLIGDTSGEGGAYRVDLRLRPHGTLGALALSVKDTVRYYETEARGWERQVMIRSRSAAGNGDLFKQFYSSVEDLVFSKNETVASALANVRTSKEKIDRERVDRGGYNVKLGPGGIREIEFIAQALQLAYGGADPWLRSAHTLISVSRLADRRLISESELSQLSTAYELLRRTEHILQMENGLQTHTLPDDPVKRKLLARRMSFASGGGDFEREIATCTKNVSSIYARVFGDVETPFSISEAIEISEVPNAADRARSHIFASLDRSEVDRDRTGQMSAVIDRIAEASPRFAAMLAANPHLVESLPDGERQLTDRDHSVILADAVNAEPDHRSKLAALRRTWARLLLEIAVDDVFGKISIKQSKDRQTSLAEASIEAALSIVNGELAARYDISPDQPPFAVLALGKLGGRGLDYDSDLDLILVYDETRPIPDGTTQNEFYSRAAELFVTALSAMTRDGNLYRVDLRLRPYGSKGLSSMPGNAFLEYMRDTAAVWEMLAFVKLRSAGGDLATGEKIENETRKIIHERALRLDPDELRSETVRIRQALEKQKSRTRRSQEIDIKYGAGGMLDVYFATRFLQLRDNVPDIPQERSTRSILDRLELAGSLTHDTRDALAAGYEFLSTLDHHLRLTVGRTTRVPLGDKHSLTNIADRMNVGSASGMLESLTLHRLNIRSAFDAILG
jgi:glutamate-ammonia-ligase adenylyltransferase